MKLPLFFILLSGIFSCKKEQQYAPDIVTGLVVNIALDGTAYDSISGLAGNIVNAVPAINRHGLPGTAMEFNRLDSSHIDFGDLVNGSFVDNRFSFCCWFMVTDTIMPVALLSKRNEFGPWEYSIDNHFDKAKFTFDNWISNGSTTVYGTDPLKAGATFTPGVWTHLAYVADGTTLRVYLNGLLQSGTDAHKDSMYLHDTDASFIIGNGGGYSKNYYFNGLIDDIRIYNKPLLSTTIQYLAGM